MTMGPCHFMVCDSSLGTVFRGQWRQRDHTMFAEVLLCRQHEQLADEDRRSMLLWVLTDEGWVYPQVWMDSLVGNRHE